MSDSKSTALVTVESGKELEVHAPKRPAKILPYTVEQVNEVTANHPEKTRDRIRWLLVFGKKMGMSTATLGKMIGRDGSTVSKLFTGKYEASDWDSITDAIERARKRHALEVTKNTRFVLTSNARKIIEGFELARREHCIVLIKGESYCGKTTTKEFYQADNNHGTTRAVEMPSGGNLVQLQRELAKVIDLSENRSSTALRETIFDGIDENNLVIIDEFNKVFPEGDRKARIKTIEFCRELHDRTQCGLALLVTPLTHKMMLHEHHEKLLKQTFNRMEEVSLRPNPTESDLEKIFAIYGLPKPAVKIRAELVDKMVINRSFGAFCKLLRSAEARAKEQKQAMSWAVVQEIKEYREILANPDMELEEETK